MSKALRHAPEPWAVKTDNCIYPVNDKEGRTVAWLNPSHPNFEGNKELIAGAPDLSNACYRHFMQPLATIYQRELRETWKRIRGVK